MLGIIVMVVGLMIAVIAIVAKTGIAIIGSAIANSMVISDLTGFSSPDGGK